MEGRPAVYADLSLRFIVSGAEGLMRASRASGLAGRGDTAGAAPSPRLILPTASVLEVTLIPELGGDSIVSAPTAIDAGASEVPVSLTEIPYGTYTVKAEAKTGAGAVLFMQTATGIAIGSNAVTVMLNLVPADATALDAAGASAIDIPSLGAGESRTWFLAPGAGLLVARSVFFSGLGPDSMAFLQSADGKLVALSHGASSRLPTMSLGSGNPAYLTVYSGSSAVPASRAFPGPAMVAVPAGAFQRDATAATNISRVSAFSMASLEVTRELYLRATGSDPSAAIGSSGMSDPVQRCSWYGAIAFCNELSSIEGLEPVYSIIGSTDRANWGAIPTSSDPDWNSAIANPDANGYRLPTEMEWMWAAMGAASDARAGDVEGGINTGGYSKGYGGCVEPGTAIDRIDDYVWHNGNSGSTTHPAGSKLPNELGLYDMSGNVLEWCWDFGGSYPSDEVLDYAGPSYSGYRVTRGGSRANSSISCAVASRLINVAPETASDSGIGFRVVRETTPTYAVRYDPNGATSGSVPVDSNTYSEGSAATVLANTGTLVKSGSAFSGWNTRPDGTGVDCMPYGGIVAVGSAPLILYAKWLDDYSSGNVGTLKAVPVGSYQRDATATNITRIRQAYRMSATEITRAQWTAVTGWADPVTGYSTGTGDPVQNVNWYHAIAFCNKLSLKEGLTPVYGVSVGGVPVDFATLTFAAIPSGAINADWNAASADWSANGYRLPTEMEWVWAAMGATSDARSGDIVAGHNAGGWSKGYAGSVESVSAYASVGDYAWYDLNCVNPENKTHPAASKIVNELGLYDMSGNVCEWMWDPYYGVLPTGMVDSDSAEGRGLGAVTYRVKKGGSWNYPYGWCAVAFRINESPWAVGSSVGFRVVRR
ncbi:MAG: SUMF1/EgtB/PvdO family nonheme iron enzyme [Spirochaetes bacterium]|nr:SUMF1/EgtB/PvdO family nonheme iron enzyme [Spirochaetota bacterium]MBU1079306.1 SUMF1/EgtB/PvdO family nonheme iron enzyme [Spirochaetota bacterium]